MATGYSQNDSIDDQTQVVDVVSHGEHYECSGEGEELLAEPYSDTGYRLQPASQDATRSNLTSRPSFHSLGPSVLNPEDVPKSLHSNENQGGPTSLHSDGGPLQNCHTSQQSPVDLGFHGLQMVPSSSQYQTKLTSSTKSSEDAVPRSEDGIKPLRSKVPTRHLPLHNNQQSINIQNTPKPQMDTSRPRQHQPGRKQPMLPPSYDKSVRRSPDRESHDRPILGDQSHEANASATAFLEALPSVPMHVNINITNINNSQFDGHGNPVNICGTQDSLYKKPTMSSSRWLGGDGQDSGIYNRSGGENNDGAATELPKKRGLHGEMVAVPDVIIEGKQTVFEEGGECDDNLDIPQSDSMSYVQPTLGHPRPSSDHKVLRVQNAVDHPATNSLLSSTKMKEPALDHSITSSDHKGLLVEDAVDQSATNSQLSSTNTKDPRTLGQLSNSPAHTFSSANQKTSHTDQCMGPAVSALIQKIFGTFDQLHTTSSAISHVQKSLQTSDKSTARSSSAMQTQQDCQNSVNSTTGLNMHTLKPQNYHLELAEPANNGKNVIIIAPTGPRNMLLVVSVLICSEHLQRQNDGPKIAFIVPTLAHLEEAYRTLKEFMPLVSVNKRTGNEHQKNAAKQPIRSLTSNDIIILTPVTLLNLLAAKDIGFGDFSLLIFDKCHRAVKDSPYSQIMHGYLKEKTLNSAAKLPQIVGLTASPNIYGNTDNDRARECIMNLCATLNCNHIQPVKQHKAEVQEFLHTSATEIMVAERRQIDPFRERVEGIMREIETKLETQLPAYEERGEQGYQSFVNKIYKKALQESRTDIKKYCSHLLEYSKVLVILDLVRMKDAMQELEDFQSNLPKQEDAPGKMLRTLYHKNVSYLLQLCDEEEQYPNPNLQVLKWGIIKEVERCADNKKEFRCMVFVEHKLLTMAIQDWMLHDNYLAKLNPAVLTGATVTIDMAGKPPQDVAIEEFRSGSRKVLVSTCIGTKGVNIPACNMVISFNYSLDEVKMIQVRDQMRADDCVEMVVRPEYKASKYKSNVVVEAAIEHAVEEIQQMTAEELQQSIKTIQQRLVKMKDSKMEKKNTRTQEHSSVEVRLLCLGCKEFVCNASDIRQSGCNYLNPDKTFAYYKVEFCTHHDKKKAERGIKKIYCTKCGQDWGNTFKGHPCLKIGSFKCETKNGLFYFKKWSQINFSVSKL